MKGRTIPRMTHKERHERRRKIATKVKQGLSKECVAKQEGVCLKTVEISCQIHGVRSEKPYTNPRVLEILAALFDKNRSVMQIARDLGISRQRVSEVNQLARKVGIPGLPKRGQKNYPPS